MQWTLGQLRNLVAEAGELRKVRAVIFFLIFGVKWLFQFSCYWVVDFPLFTFENGKLLSTHHPFTAPVEEHTEKLLSPDEHMSIIG